MTTTRFAAVLLGVLVAGCVGTIDDLGDDTTTTTTPAPTDPTPKAAFDREVDTILVGKCTGCHETSATNVNFVDPTPATAYATITALSPAVGDFTPSGTPILTKLIGGHNGVTYAPAEVSAIEDWLAKEVAARHTQPQPPGGTTDPIGPAAILAAENTWSGCITLADFRSADMARAWGNLQATDPQEACSTCHVTGGNDFIASDDEPVFFNFVTTKRKYMLQYFAVDTSRGTVQMAVNWTSFNQVSGGDVHHVEHPLFAFNNDGMQALTTLYGLVAGRLAAGQCAAPTLTE